MLTLSLLAAGLIAGLVFYLMFRSDRNRNTPLPWLIAGLRAVLSFLIALLIFAPKMTRRVVEEQKPLALFLQDHSLSVGKALGDQKVAFSESRTKLLKQLSKDFRVLTWNLGGPVAQDSLDRYNATTTNLAKPIEEAIDQFYQQNLSTVIIASDGQMNEGANPTYSSFPLNSFVYSIAIGDTSHMPDLRVSKLYANKTVSLNSDWELLADLTGAHIGTEDIQVILSDETGRELARTNLQAQGGSISRQIAFSLKAEQEGLHQYIVKVTPLQNESNTINNKNSITVQVQAEKKKILLAYASPHPDIKAISAALQGHKQYELELREATALPTSTDAYAAIILHQLPATGKMLPPNWTKGKNVWYIAGAQSNYAELNNLQQTIRYTPGTMRSGSQVTLNKSFGLFHLAADLPAVTELLPPLQTTGDASLSGSGQILFSETGGRPLWVISQGNPATAVTSGEGLWRWRLYEYKNFEKQSTVDECILQTLNLLSNADRDRRFRAEPAKNSWSSGEQIVFSAWLNNAAGEAINTPEVAFQLKDSSGKIYKWNFERSAKRYRLNIGALSPGTYVYTASTSVDGKTFSDQGKFFVNESSLELSETGCNYPLLATLAHKNHGSVFMSNQLNALYETIKNNTAIKPVLIEREEPVDLISWKWLFFLILGIATIEWLLRKYWMAM